jgi:hypothetical protein
MGVDILQSEKEDKPLKGDELFLIESTVKTINFPTKEDPLQIVLARTGYEAITLNFYQVDRLRTTSASTNNIIDRIVMWNSESSPASYRREMRWLLTGDYDHDVGSDYKCIFEDLMNKVDQDHLVICQIEPVAGIELIILCTRVTWSIGGSNVSPTDARGP